MVIRIRNQKKRFYDEEGNELSGECSFLTPQRMSIRISRHCNRTVNKYAGTLLHELLHAWINVLELKGFKTNDEKEEVFVETVEQIVVRAFQKNFGRK